MVTSGAASRRLGLACCPAAASTLGWSSRVNGLPCAGGGEWRAYERPSEAGEGSLGSSGVAEFHVPAAHALVAGERARRATSGSEAEAEAAGARQLFGGGDRPSSSRREPEEPKETLLLCTDTRLMLHGARSKNRDFGKGVTTEPLGVK